MTPETISPPSAPMLTAMPASNLETQLWPSPTHGEVTSAAPEPDDIPDPVVPEAAKDLVLPALPTALSPGQIDFNIHEAQIHGFLQYLQGKMHAWMQQEHLQVAANMDLTLASIRDWARALLTVQDQSQAAWSDTLAHIATQGLALRSDPYKASVVAVSPQGFHVTLHIVKQDAEALTNALPKLLGWLQDSGYTAFVPMEMAEIAT